MLLVTPPPLVLVPPVFSNVPALLNVGGLPPSKAICVSTVWFHVAPARLLKIDPFSIRNSMPDQVAVALLFNVRVSRNGSPERAMPPLAFVIPVPLSVPPDHVSIPVIVRVPVPDNVPELSSSVVTELAPFSVRVPPLTFRSANVAVPLMVSGPEVKDNVAPEVRLLIV